MENEKKYKWFAVGDINGFFGLMFDNLTVLSFLAGILIFAFKFPADIVYTKMFPGTAFGVLFGDAVYTWMAFRLAKKTGNTKVTAMPLGLDTPSTIGIALVVLGPAFIGLKAEGLGEHDAAMMTWYIGMATMVVIGIIKVLFSFIGAVGAAGCSAGRASRIAGRHRTRTYRLGSAGRYLQHADCRNDFARTYFLLTCRSDQTAEKFSWES